MYYFDGMNEFDASEYHNNAKSYEEEYLPKIWRKVSADDVKFGHGGIDGLLHISEMSWGRVENPSKIFKVGDEVDALIKEVDDEKQKVSLSMRALLEGEEATEEVAEVAEAADDAE